jgi:hypothetical protein
MMDTGSSITANELLKAARASGFAVSRAQLARWHRSGWLPAPKQRRLGRGRGTESVYPLEARDRLWAICALPVRQRHSPLVEWQLWWRGFEVPIETVRRHLAQVAQSWERAIRELRTGDELSPKAQHFIKDVSAAKRLPRGLANRARGRVGKANFTSFMNLLMLMGTGLYQPSTNDIDNQIDQSILLRGLGLQNAEWMPKSVISDFESATFQLGKYAPSRLVESATDADLFRARFEMNILVSALNIMVANAPKSPGVSNMFNAVEAVSAEPYNCASFLLAWMMMRSNGLGESLFEFDTQSSAMQDSENRDNTSR